jgi:tRNA1Val (adenine37-N6)-methyltransferase
MGNPYFQFKKFTIYHHQSAMKVTTDACLFGAWCAREIENGKWKIENLLDIGTGTGLLSLMIAQKNNIVIDAVEIDGSTAEEARNNVLFSPFKDQIQIIKTNILDFENTGYDVIVSNPPFYENELESQSKEKNTAHHGYGLKWEELFGIINKKLTDTGKFFLLLPYKRKTDLEILLEKESLHANNIVLVKQSVQHSPFRILLQGSKQKFEKITSTLSITDEQKKYTAEFTHLLKDYYLYL